MKDSVIPFALSSAQLHDLALSLWQDGQPLEAIERMRRALEAEPDNLAYRASLARFLTNAGCVSESMHVLTPGYVRLQNMTLPLMLMYLSIDTTNDGVLLFPLMQKTLSLKLFLTQPPRATLKKATRLMAQHYSGMRYPLYYKNRLERLRAFLLAGEPKRALDILGRGRVNQKDQPPIFRAIYSIANTLSGQKQEALDAFCGLRQEELRVWLEMASSKQSANIQAEPISQLFSSTNDFILLASLLINTLPESAQRAHLELEALPPAAGNRITHDALILHMLAVASYNQGMSAQSVAEYWSHILKLHPYDIVADQLLRLARADALPARPMPYAYRLDEQAANSYRKMVSAIAFSVQDALATAWRELKPFRHALIWMMRAEPEAFGPIAAQLLSSLNHAQRLELANDYCFATGQNGPHMCAILSLMSEKAELAFCRALYAGAKPLSLQGELSIRCAEVGIERLVGYSSEPVLKWLLGDSTRKLGKNIRGQAVELAWRYARLIGVEADDKKLARLLSISPRLVRYRTRAAIKEEHS